MKNTKAPRAFYGNQEIKSQILAFVKEQMKFKDFISDVELGEAPDQVFDWEDYLIRVETLDSKQTPKEYANGIGFPIKLFALQCMLPLFLHEDGEDYSDFTYRFFESVPVGADLSKVTKKFDIRIADTTQQELFIPTKQAEKLLELVSQSR